MIRLARESDVWKKAYRRNYKHLVKNIDLNGLGGINRIEIEKGIFAICGLNGAGKSTIISSLKDILGIEINYQDIQKINGKEIIAEVVSNEEVYEVKNEEESRFLDKDEIENPSIYYLDYKQSIKALDYFEQDNIEELLEQYEENVIPKESISELSYIVGREYDEVKIIEIEDGEDILPYFKVKSSNLEYTSIGMGMGEHFLFYIFWVLYRIDNSGIILIEEPETFVSIKSQQKLMNFIAKKAGDLGVSVILASHSPYIIRKIKKENIIVLSRFSNNVSVLKPSVERDSLGTLGLEIPKQGCIFVEDRVAGLFLKTALSRFSPSTLMDYDFEYVNGHAEITKRLRFPYSAKFSYDIIGIYDGDMKKEIEEIKESLNWDYYYLPTNESIESEFKETLKEDCEEFSKLLYIPHHIMIQILAEIDGEESHDWFLKLITNCGKDISVITEVLFNLWIKNKKNEENVKVFISELNEHISS